MGPLRSPRYRKTRRKHSRLKDTLQHPQFRLLYPNGPLSNNNSGTSNPAWHIHLDKFHPIWFLACAQWARNMHLLKPCRPCLKACKEFKGIKAYLRKGYLNNINNPSQLSYRSNQ